VFAADPKRKPKEVEEKRWLKMNPLQRKSQEVAHLDASKSQAK
jgi:hypothetical protein